LRHQILHGTRHVRAVEAGSSVSQAEIQKARRALDEQYLNCRAASLVLEARLEGILSRRIAVDFKSPGILIFESKDPAAVWH
jgi:hypothetical protein